MDRFLRAYLGLFAPHVAAYVAPEKFIPAWLAATRAMVENTDPGVTNQQAFVADFFPRVGRTMDELMPVFDDFYSMQFGKLRSHTRCLPEAHAVVRAAFDACRAAGLLGQCQRRAPTKIRSSRAWNSG